MRMLVLTPFLAGEVVLALFLMGCGAIDDARRLEPAGDGFADALAGGYRDFALYEADSMYDWPDARHFAVKALAAAAGARPDPEDPKDWDLPAAAARRIGAARARLVRALDGGARERFADDAAAAQVDLDCWIEQQEENWQADHIARCRDRFYAALARLEKRFAEAFLMFFPFDSAVIGAAGRDALDAVVETAAAGRAVIVSIGGHADRAGPRAYNRALSERRARAVRRALEGRGIDPRRMAVRAFGESRPLVATPDGMRRARNRRVEVIITPAEAL